MLPELFMRNSLREQNSNPGEANVNHPDRVEYQSDPTKYKHWTLGFDGPVATLKADFDENAGLRPGYKLKLNSYY